MCAIRPEGISPRTFTTGSDKRRVGDDVTSAVASPRETGGWIGKAGGAMMVRARNTLPNERDRLNGVSGDGEEFLAQ